MDRAATGLIVGLLACAGLLAGCNGASNAALNKIGQEGNKGFMVKTVKRGMWTRKYGLFVPLSYRPGTAQKYPVIVFLHGIGEGSGLGEGDLKNMKVGLAPAVAERQDRFDFIVIFPQSGGTWDPNSEYVSDMFAALDQVSREYPVDPDRVILTGLSTGGAGTWAIGSKYHDRFAAIVPMASNASNPGRDAANLKDMPVRAYCSMAGDIFALWHDQTMVNTIKESNPRADAKFTATPTLGHDCWEDVYRGEELFAWLRQQRRPGGGGGLAQGSPAAQPTVALVDAIRPAQGRGVVVSSSAAEQRAQAKPVAAAPKAQEPRPAAASVVPTSGTYLIAPPSPAPRAVAPAAPVAAPRDGGAWVNTSW